MYSATLTMTRKLFMQLYVFRSYSMDGIYVSISVDNRYRSKDI